jgi:hypothetical protein
MEHPLEGMTVVEGLSVRFHPADQPFLAVLAAAPRDVARWRLLILAPDGRLVYDEILAKQPHLLKAHRVDGAQTLLLSGADGLRALLYR